MLKVHGTSMDIRMATYPMSHFRFRWTLELTRMNFAHGTLTKSMLRCKQRRRSGMKVLRLIPAEIHSLFRPFLLAMKRRCCHAASMVVLDRCPRTSAQKMVRDTHYLLDSMLLTLSSILLTFLSIVPMANAMLRQLRIRFM